MENYTISYSFDDGDYEFVVETKKVREVVADFIKYEYFKNVDNEEVMKGCIQLVEDNELERYYDEYIREHYEYEALCEYNAMRRDRW